MDKMFTVQKKKKKQRRWFQPCDLVECLTIEWCCECTITCRGWNDVSQMFS